jgi:ankyrin repeat protein
VNDQARPSRVLPARPNLDHLKRQAKELLAAFRAAEPAAIAEVNGHYHSAEPPTFALHEAQLVLARAYGFSSWPNLRAFVEGGGRRQLIRPVELQSASSDDVWNTILAASTGDMTTLRQLLARNPQLARAEYWYSPVLHFAVREGHVDAVRLLLETGADPESNGLNDRNLIEMAAERGHAEIVTLLEQARDQRGRVRRQTEDHAIHRAAARGETRKLRTLLESDASLLNLGSSRGFTPLHYAVLGQQESAVKLLLEQGANLHARSSTDLEPIDLALFGDRGEPRDLGMARLLVSRGATFDLAVAAAFGDLAAVRAMLAADAARIRETRPSGSRPLSTAVMYQRNDIAALLLASGANPLWPERDAPHGICLHWAARLGELAMVKMLLDHGADPNEDIDSTAPPADFAANPGIRALLESRGAVPGLYDPEWIEKDPALLQRVAADPAGHTERIGVAFVMSADCPDLLARLLAAGIRMPAVHTSCQTYLLKPDVLRLLLAHGMPADQMNWQHQTLLHHAAAQDNRECAAILLDAGASLTARDDEYRSTPLAWAARANKPQMVEFLLSRGAAVDLPEDKAEATALAWATRRGFDKVVAILRAHGAAR